MEPHPLVAAAPKSVTVITIASLGAIIGALVIAAIVTADISLLSSNLYAPMVSPPDFFFVSQKKKPWWLVRSLGYEAAGRIPLVAKVSRLHRR